MKALFLKIFYKEKLVKVQPFIERQLSIGSGEGLNLKLEGLPAWQCLIEEKNNQYKIFDLESDLETFLNGEEIKGDAPIKTGDMITLGEYHIQFFIDAPKDDVKPVFYKTSKKDIPSVPSSKKALDEQKVASLKEGVKPTQAKDTSQMSPYFKKKTWNTFAPPSKITNLDEYLEPSIGNLIEVTVAWKERVLSVSHFSKSGSVTIGSSSDCDIVAPVGRPVYDLLQVQGGARVFLKNGITGVLIQGKNKSTRTSTNLAGNKDIVLKPYEIIRLNFGNSLSVYVRIQHKSQPVVAGGLFRLRKTEFAVLLFSALLTFAVVVYSAFYAPLFLLDDVDLIEEKIRVATVRFEKVPKAPPVITDYKLGDKTQKAKRKRLKKKLVKKIQKKTTIKKPKDVKKPKVVKKLKPVSKPKVVKKPKPVSKPKVVKKQKRGSLKASSLAKGRKKPSSKARSGSKRPGGSLKTGKRGSAPKTVAPDPTKVGLLGVFGGGGKLKKLDKGSSGTAEGGILGLAKTATGFSGTEDGYSGSGVGTKTKDLGSGGEGSALVGISKIKTKDRGSSLLAKKGRGNELGTRGRVNIETGADDIEVEGEIDRAAILRAIRKNKSRFDRCYQAALQKKSAAQGHLKMRWTILSNGRGNDAEVVSDGVGNPSLSGCVGKVLESTDFPIPPSGQIPRISFKFIFSI